MEFIIGIMCLAVPAVFVLAIVGVAREALHSRKALTNCADCRNKVSRRASVCPHCGAPLDASSGDAGHAAPNDGIGDILKE